MASSPTNPHPYRELHEMLHRRYRVLSLLGEGATSAVYVVEHVELGHREALKILFAQLAGSDEFARRFRREARALHRLQHPNIVGLRELGRTADGRFFLTSELVEGRRLDEVVATDGPLSEARALDVLVQLAEAVAHAHARGVIHRDLKPQNLMLVTERGRSDLLKVLDFGIAKIVAPTHVDSVNLTKPGAVIGSPSYLAPEQVHAQGQIDTRADIYAIGCVAHELLTGEPPFTGRLMEVLHAHCSRQPARGRMPAAIEPIVLRCLAKSPADRYQTAEALARALREAAPAKQTRSPNDLLLGSDTLLDEPLESGARPEITAELHGTLRQVLAHVGAAMVDMGCADHRLLLALTTMSEREADLERATKHRDACQRYMVELEERAVQMQTSLRFAASQLRFERDHARLTNCPVDGDLDFQIRELEQRVLDVQGDAEEQLAAHAERIIELTVEHSAHEDALFAQTAVLEQIVRSLAPAYLGRSGIGSMIQQYREARGRVAERAKEVA